MSTSASDIIRFTCDGCGYSARLASSYAGKAIRCPRCEQPQLVLSEPRPSAAVAQRVPGGDAIAFGCGACGHRAVIGGEYAGKVVWCPTCNAVQIVPKHAPLDEPRTGAEQFACESCGFTSRV